MRKLHEVKPREGTGRDTIARYRLQFVAAAYASLEVLEGKEIDRIFCDYHDDFVVRHRKDGQHTYHFYQVKTKEKRNHQWTLVDSFGLNKRAYAAPDKDDLAKIRDSFFGRLLLHTLNFGHACKELSLLTNVNFRDDVEALVTALSNNTENLHTKFLIEKFHQIFGLSSALSAETVRDHLKKLSIKPNTSYVDPGNGDFTGVAREAIYKYSEIDLSHEEAAKIALNFVALVFNKSFKKIMRDITEADLDDLAGVGIDDLLAVLSISKVAYGTLLEGGDERALKSASIIQRRLRKAGAQDSMVEFCTRQKVAWDIWIRDKRHSASELEFNLLQEEVANLARQWNGADWDWLQRKLDSLAEKMKQTALGTTITPELLIGGVFAMLIKIGSL